MFSIRDDRKSAPAILKNQSGQGIVEYVLILVATVALVLGGIYQLNTAFKSWANNYFGNYLACLLESGELPALGGAEGGSGICNEIFKPFSLAEGRTLKTDYTPPEGTNTSRSGGGSREAGLAGQRVGGNSGGGRGGGGAGGGRFGNGQFGQNSRKSGSSARRKPVSSTFTGNMAASDYGSAGGSRRRINVGVKQRLDTRFAFQDERERPQKRTYVGGGRRPSEEGAKAPPIRVKPSELKKSKAEGADSGLTLPSFLKWIIIAGIIIALIVFLGGQGLQINKSME